MRAALAVLWLALSARLTSGTNCNNCVPGSGFLGLGFDALSGETRFPVIQMTTDQGLAWTNPFFPNVSYTLFDRTNLFLQPFFDAQSYTFHSSTDYANYLALTSGVDFGFGSVFSLNAAVTYVQSEVDRTDNAFALSFQDFSLYSLSLDAPAVLNVTTLFAQDLARLPAQYDFAAYSKFLGTYGTHVVTLATVGGRMQYSGVVGADFAGRFSDLVVRTNAQLFGFGGTAAYSHATATSAFEAEFADATACVGGDATLCSGAQWGPWVESVKAEPSVLNVQLVNVTAFVTDPTIASNMEQAILEYFSAQVVNVPSVPMGNLSLVYCGCFYVLSNYSCPLGTVVHDPGSGVSCCEPCYSWAAAGALPPAQSTRATTTEDAAAMPAKQSKSLSTTRHHPQRTGQRGDTSVPGSAAFQRPATAARFDVRFAAPTGVCGALPCIPGLDVLGTGYDARLGRDVGRRAVALTFAQNYTWTDPYTGVTYAVPDQVVYTPASAATAQTQLFYSYQSVLDTMTSSVGVTVTDVGLFGASVAANQAWSSFWGQQTITAQFQNSIQLYELDMDLNAGEPSAGFAATVDALPTAVQSGADSLAYVNFLRTFGTHVVEWGAWGGQATVNIAVDTYTVQTINSRTELEAFTELAFQVFTGTNSTAQSSVFAAGSVATFNFVGGSYEAFQPHEYGTWKQTIQSGPARIKFTLTSICKLIADPDKAMTCQIVQSQYLNVSRAEFVQYPGVACQPDGGHGAGELVQGTFVQARAACVAWGCTVLTTDCQGWTCLNSVQTWLLLSSVSQCGAAMNSVWAPSNTVVVYGSPVEPLDTGVVFEAGVVPYEYNCTCPPNAFLVGSLYKFYVYQPKCGTLAVQTDQHFGQVRPSPPVLCPPNNWPNSVMQSEWIYASTPPANCWYGAPNYYHYACSSLQFFIPIAT